MLTGRLSSAFTAIRSNTFSCNSHTQVISLKTPPTISTCTSSDTYTPTHFNHCCVSLISLRSKQRRLHRQHDSSPRRFIIPHTITSIHTLQPQNITRHNSCWKPTNNKTSLYVIIMLFLYWLVSYVSTLYQNKKGH